MTPKNGALIAILVLGLAACDDDAEDGSGSKNGTASGSGGAEDTIISSGSDKNRPSPELSDAEVQDLSTRMTTTANLAVGLAAPYDDGEDRSGSGDGSGSGGSGDMTISSGVDKDKNATELSDAEVQDLCLATTSKTAAMNTTSMEVICASSGLMAASLVYGMDESAADADLQKVCSDAYAECMEPDTTDTQQTPEEECADASASDIPPDCDITVAQFETCMSDYLAAETKTLDATLQSIPACDEITKDVLVQWADGDAHIPETPVPASCQVLQDKCPSGYDF